MNKIYDNLKKVGFSPQWLKCQGGRILILDYGARVLGLYSNDEKENFFWHNPLLQAEDGLMGLIKSIGWKNVGGSRTWISPEGEFFINNPSDPWKTYNVPNSLDPGAFTIETFRKSVKIKGKVRLISHIKNKGILFSIEKRIKPAVNPIYQKIKSNSIFSGLQYVGYEQEIILKIVSSEDPRILIGLWNLIQFPKGGDVIIPVTCAEKPFTYFGKSTIAPLICENNFIKFHINATEKHKIGIKAYSLIGRVGYLRKVKEDCWTLVVCNFFVNPSGEYIDTPWKDLSDKGYALQCYNDDGKLGDFGEVEYHSPAIGIRRNNECIDQSQVWGFKGNKQQIKKILKMLIGFNIDKT